MSRASRFAVPVGATGARGSRAAAAAALAALLLGACSSSPEAPPPACPKVLAVKGADRTVAYRPGPGRDAADIRQITAISGLESGCRYRSSGTEVALRFDLLAQKGAAFGAPVPLVFFIATIAPGQRIVDKKLFNATVDFPPDRDTAGLRQTFTFELPGVAEVDGPSWSLYVGFQGEAGAAPAPATPESLLR